MQRTSRKHPGLPVGGPARQAPATKTATGRPVASTSARPKRTGMLALSLRANRIPHAPAQPRSYLPPQLKARQGTWKAAWQEARLQDALMDALVEQLVQASGPAESCLEPDQMAQRTAAGLVMLRDWIIGMTSPATALDLLDVRRKIVMQISAVAAPMATRMALVMACLVAAQASGYRHGARLQTDFVKMANRAPDEERLAILLAACCTTGPRTSTNDSIGLACALAADALRTLQDEPLRRALGAAARLDWWHPVLDLGHAGANEAVDASEAKSGAPTALGTCLLRLLDLFAEPLSRSDSGTRAQCLGAMMNCLWRHAKASETAVQWSPVVDKWMAQAHLLDDHSFGKLMQTTYWQLVLIPDPTLSARAVSQLVTSLAAQAPGAPGPRLQCLEEFITMLASHLRRQLPECAEVRTLVRRCAGTLAGILAPLPHDWAIALRADLKAIEADARQNLERLAQEHLEQMEDLVQDCTQS